MAARVLVVLALLGCTRAREDAPPPPVQVAAAADLAHAFEVLGRDFEQRTGQRVRFSFGSTGLLAKQLREGAPFDLFAAANESFVREVVAAGACDEATVAPYGRGRLVVWSRRDGVEPAPALEALADARFKRLAIAMPEHAPYGRATKEALQRVGAWASVAPRLVYGENVRQALQYAQTRNVEAAVVALSLVVEDRDNPWVLVPESLHEPLTQALVVCRHGRQRAGGEAFGQYVNSEDGRRVMRAFGFLLPGEEAVAP